MVYTIHYYSHDETNKSIGLWRSMIWIFPSDTIPKISLNIIDFEVFLTFENIWCDYIKLQVSSVWPSPILWCSVSLRNLANISSPALESCISKFVWKILRKITRVSRLRNPIPSYRTEKLFLNSRIKCVFQNHRTNIIDYSWWLVRCRTGSLRTLTA